VLQEIKDKARETDWTFPSDGSHSMLYWFGSIELKRWWRKLGE